MQTKTIFKTLAFAMLMPAMLLTTACSSDDDAVNNNENTQKKYYEIPVTVTVTRQGDGTRATYDGETKELSFSTGDKLFVNGHHEEAGFFAGALVLLSASDGTFEGTVIAQSSYTGTAEAFLKGADEAFATLLPAGYENYNYLKFYLNDNPVNAITSPWTSVSAIINNSLLPLGKAEAVAQLSYEYAPNYNNYVFTLTPQRPVICCTITGLPVETSVPVVYDGSIDVSGNITTDASGTATFAFTNFAEDPLGSLTVNGNAIDLPSRTLEAGKIFNINRSIAPAGPTAYTLAESTKGMIVGTDGMAYDVAYKDNLPSGVTAAGVVVYKSGSNGLAIALTDEVSTMNWATANGASGAAAHTPAVSGQTWKLPSQEEWTLVKNANDNSGTTLNSAITSAGGTAIPTYSFMLNPTATYWLSTENGSDIARIWCINGGDEIVVSNADQDLKTENKLVRACLAF